MGARWSGSAAIGLGVESSTHLRSVLDEFQLGAAGEGLMIDVALWDPTTNASRRTSGLVDASSKYGGGECNL
jgi:hypothetical protein